MAGVEHGVIPDIINHKKNGFLFEDNKKDCAEKIKSDLENRNLFKENGNSINFDHKIASKKLEKVYQEAIKKQRERESYNLLYMLEG